MFLSKLIRYIKRKVRGLVFTVSHPAFWGVDVLNPSQIKVAGRTRISSGSRLFLFDKTARLRIDQFVWGGRNIDLHADNGATLRVCHHVSLQDNCKIIGDVEIGAYSIFAPNVFLSSSGHQFRASPAELIRKQDSITRVSSRKITIGEDVWIGINAVISAGVTVGRGAVIGAGSVVTKDVPPYSVWAGTPARQIDTRLSFSPKGEISSDVVTDRPYFYKGFDHLHPDEKGLRIVEECALIKLRGQGASTLELHCILDHNDPKALSVDFGGSEKRSELKAGAQVITFDVPPTSGDLDLRLRPDSADVYIRRVLLSEGKA